VNTDVLMESEKKTQTHTSKAVKFFI